MSNASSQVATYLMGTRPEPTGFESSVANFIPLPNPVGQTVSKGAPSAGFGGNGWGSPPAVIRAAAARAKAAGRRSTRFRVADCGGAERTAAHRRSRPWSLARNDPSPSSSEAAWTVRSVMGHLLV
ncbi:MAG: hypothetical protein E6I91_16375 [Chloroflexi bacterium]|nr:MAG: hypothetical protein E6I91_16375 [Chloroflexota bacterium]